MIDDFFYIGTESVGDKRMMSGLGRKLKIASQNLLSWGLQERFHSNTIMLPTTCDTEMSRASRSKFGESSQIDCLPSKVSTINNSLKILNENVLYFVWVLILTAKLFKLFVSTKSI